MYGGFFCIVIIVFSYHYNMKGSIRFTLLMLGMIAMVACVFDSSDTKTDRGYDIVLSQDSPVSAQFSVITGYGFIPCTFESKGIPTYNDLSFGVEKFYVSNHESKDLFELTIGNLAATQFG